MGGLPLSYKAVRERLRSTQGCNAMMRCALRKQFIGMLLPVLRNQRVFSQALLRCIISPVEILSETAPVVMSIANLISRSCKARKVDDLQPSGVARSNAEHLICWNPRMGCAVYALTI